MDHEGSPVWVLKYLWNSACHTQFSYGKIEPVILFGSRARGDFKERSDIDLAFQGGDTVNFSLDVDEETSTLLMFDLVDLGRPVSEELRQAIFKEGVTVYEKV